MIKLGDLLKEGVGGNDFINFLLVKIQPVINHIIVLQKQKAQKDGEKFSKYDEEFAELTLKYDLLKALGNYAKSSDKLIKGSVTTSNKGSLTIDAVIERDGVEYPLLNKNRVILLIAPSDFNPKLSIGPIGSTVIKWFFNDWNIQ